MTEYAIPDGTNYADFIQDVVRQRLPDFLAGINLAEVPTWETTAELNQMSIEAFLREFCNGQ